MNLGLSLSQRLTPTPVTRRYHTTKFVAAKHAPTMLVGGGIAGIIISTAMACRATYKNRQVFENFQDEVRDLKTFKSDEAAVKSDSLTPADYRREMTTIYTRNAGSIAKVYAPSATVMTISLVGIVGAHRMMLGRNAALLATATSLSESLRQYRDRVSGELGVDKESELYQNMTPETIFDPETGKKIQVMGIDPGSLSPYARFFDEQSERWQKDADINRITVDCQMKYANHKLHTRGHLFLNEVYDMLGLPRTKAGNVVGWIYRPEPQPEGDGYVDFNLFDARNRDFNRSWERSALLDFNVDGPIIDKIGAKDI